MHPHEFIEKWRAASLKERSAAHEHFLDLCRLLDERTPAEADPDGVWYAFERGARKTGGGDGWADVWKRGCFGWEYKGKRANLDDAFAQLQRYPIALENPPLLIAGGAGAPAAMHPVGAPAPNGIVSDIETIRVHTNFTNTVQQVHTIALDDLEDPEKRRLLKWAFSEPERLRPGTTREAITERAASEFAAPAQRLRGRSSAG